MAYLCSKVFDFTCNRLIMYFVKKNKKQKTKKHKIKEKKIKILISGITTIKTPIYNSNICSTWYCWSFLYFMIHVGTNLNRKDPVNCVSYFVPISIDQIYGSNIAF